MNNTSYMSKKTIAFIEGQSTLVRPSFGPGMLLHHEDLEQINTYTRELSRVIFRSLLGCGVICGLTVSVVKKCGKVYVTVGAGLALDGLGNPVHVPKDQQIVLLDDDNCEKEIKGALWVILCSKTRKCAPRVSMCAPDDDESLPMHTRERDGFEIRVVDETPDCICAKPGYKDEKQPDADPCSEAGCNDCDCECILLARITQVRDKRAYTGDNSPEWDVSHRVRRYIRPQLLDDPQVRCDEQAPASAPTQADAAIDITGDDEASKGVGI